MSGMECRLRAVDGAGGVVCDSEECSFQRSSDWLGLLEMRSECAIRYFQLLGRDEDLAEWLLAMKQRLDEGGTDLAAV